MPSRSFFACLLCALLVLGSLVPGEAGAAPTSERQARQAVQGWLAQDPQPLGTRMAASIKNVVSYQDAAGEAAYHIVFLAPAGLVIVAGDDLVEPIVGFVPEAVTYDPSSNNPVGALVSADLPGRTQAVRASVNAATRKGGSFKATGALAVAQGRWQKLTATTAGALQARFGISDVRVAPLLQSRWNQTTAAGVACYNYYTPPGPAGSASNYPCGCSITAMAQVMRYHRYPTAGVGGSLRGGDGAGGPYNWDNMPLIPNDGITTTQCQAIGALCSDGGIAAGTSYAAGGSATSHWGPQRALLGTFQYSNVVDGYPAVFNLGHIGMINPNLDAGYPTLLGIFPPDDGPGHTVVCDGYGYNDSTMYHHLNLGWGGSATAWYNLPNVYTGPYVFTDIFNIDYNIYPTGSGEIISGRITTAEGIPASGVTVTAVRSGGTTYTATTNTNGIYAFAKIPSNSSYTIGAAKNGYSLGASQAIDVGESMNSRSGTGNVWGVNFSCVPTSPSLMVSAVALNSSGNPGGPFTSASATYIVKNTGPGTLAWKAAKTASWVTLSKTGGSLAAGTTNTVTLTINSGANALAIGSYRDTVSFTNTTNGNGNTTCAVSLTVNNPNGWHLATGAASWDPRDFTGSVSFNNKLWLIGGSTYNYTCNDVWSSGDGTNWILVTGAAAWSARYNHVVMVFNGKMVLLGGMGGFGTDVKNDVWSSSDGANWTPLTSAAPWSPRKGFGATVFKSRIWVLGGYDDTAYRSDIWSSSDGTSWTQVSAAAPWPARYRHRVEVLNGRLYVMGGIGGSGSDYYNDVWSSSDGVNWRQETASAAWPAFVRNGSAVFDNKLWILGGVRSNYDYSNEVWCSSNGTTWTQSPVSVPWSTRSALSATVFQNRLYILGGEKGVCYNDVWYLPVSTQAGLNVTPGSGLSSSGKQGGPFTPTSAAYTLTNTGTATLAWTAAKTAGWVTLSKTSGSLAAGASDSVTATINTTAKTLPAGTYSNTVTFTNTTNGQGNTNRAISLKVNSQNGINIWRMYP